MFTEHLLNYIELNVTITRWQVLIDSICVSSTSELFFLSCEVGRYTLGGFMNMKLPKF